MISNKSAVERRFRPKADARLLRERLDAGWQARYARLFPETDKAEVGAVLTAHLEALYPAADMVVLHHYGEARDISEITVRVRAPGTDVWDKQVTIPLARTVRVPGGTSMLFCGGPWLSRDPDRGVKGGRARYETLGCGTWEALIADQDAQERSRVPEQWEPFFYRIVEERRRYKRDYAECTGWPAKYRSEHGCYPLWSELEAEFEVLREVTA